MNKDMFDRAVKTIKELGLELDALIVKNEDCEYRHIFSGDVRKANIRSISKPVACLCYGIAIDKGYFSKGLDEEVYPYLLQTQNITNMDNLAYIKKWTLRTLLTLTIGYEMKMLDSKHLRTIEGQNYGDVVLNAPLYHGPGEYFIYSNAAMYLASIVFQNALDMKLADFANAHLFGLMGIDTITWRESPQGYNMGCTGIEMYPADLVKLGELLLSGGMYAGKRIVSETWVSSMLTPQVLTPMMYDERRVLPKYAYGFNMWICKDGIAYCDGTDGQYLILLPDKKTVIVTTGRQADMKPITRCLEEIIRD